MKETLNHKILTSFFLWFDHNITEDLEAYIEHESQLYYIEDERIPFNSFSSPYKQWVVDSSSQAYIPTGISVNNTGVTFNSGTFVDWNNGRILTNEYNENDIITCRYSTKEINTYITNDEEDIIFQQNYNINPYYTIPPETGVQPYDLYLPACFILNANNDSKPYSMGSSDFQDKSFNFRVLILSNNTYHIDGILSHFEDKVNKSFKLLEIYDDPFNEYGALKNIYSNGYNYKDLINSKINSDLVYIESVKGSKISIGSNNIPNGMKAAILMFKLSYHRKPS